MNTEIGMPKETRSALRDGIIVQVVLGMIMLPMLDGGMCAQVWVFSMIAYWGGCGLILLRRRNVPTKLDLVLIRWGFLMLCLIVTPAVAAAVWGLRGVNLR
jgi:hypothetical protein